MILTQKKINDAILKGKCCLASKTIKYFNQLSYGKDDMNLFKCINVLDIAIETLCKFEIVGSTSECPCTIEGTFLIEGLNELIQFNNDGTGYVNGEFFTWYTQNDVVYISLGIYTFNYTCDENGNLILSNFNDFLTYISSLNITNSPFTDTNITLSILDSSDTLLDTVTVSSNDTPEEIVNQFNEDNTLNLVMQYNTPNDYQVYSPLFNDYTNYTFTWNQVEAPFTALFNITSWGNTSQTLDFTDSNNIVYTFSNPGGGDETTFMLLLEAWLETQPFEMTVVFNENVMTFSTSDPLFSGTQPSSVQLTLIEGAEETSYDSPFTTNVIYETTFEGAETLNLINQEECTPETVEQTCLSNKQIGDIINYINKTCTDC
jgi:hypothetical protein